MTTDIKVLLSCMQCYKSINMDLNVHTIHILITYKAMQSDRFERKQGKQIMYKVFQLPKIIFKKER